MRLFLILVLVGINFLYPIPSHALTLETTESFGDDAVQIKITPNYTETPDGKKLIGFRIFTVFKTGEIGTAFFKKDSFYSFDSNELIHDYTYYRAEALQSDAMLSKPIMQIAMPYGTYRYRSENLSEFFVTAAKIASSDFTKSDLEDIYDTYGRSAGFLKNKEIFTHSSPTENTGTKETAWRMGVLEIEGQEVRLKLSKKTF